METTRQQKINRLIQKELGEIFLLQTKAMPGILVSVSGVRISPDLSVAKAYLSIFPSEKGKELLANIKTNVKAMIPSATIDNHGKFGISIKKRSFRIILSGK